MSEFKGYFELFFDLFWVLIDCFYYLLHFCRIYQEKQFNRASNRNYHVQSYNSSSANYQVQPMAQQVSHSYDSIHQQQSFSIGRQPSNLREVVPVQPAQPQQYAYVNHQSAQGRIDMGGGIFKDSSSG